jgi:pimeloyl-ACP methyl ester carboxylesterase
MTNIHRYQKIIRWALWGLFCIAPPLAAEPFDVSVDGPYKNDPLILQGDFTPPTKTGLPVLICVHGLGSTRGEWAPLAAAAHTKGWGSYLVDLPGHGRSRTTLSGKTINHEDRNVGGNPAFWQDMPAQLGRITEVLESQKNVTAAQRVLVGASLGANICLLSTVESTAPVAGLVLLSPGLEYAGLRAGEAMGRLTRPVLLVSAATDLYAHASAEHLLSLAPPGLARWTALPKGSPRGDHGAQLFDGALEKKILEWVGVVTHTETPQKPSFRRKPAPKR